MNSRAIPIILALLSLLLALPATAAKGEVKIDGTVVSAYTGSMVVQARWGQATVLLQRSTEIKGNRFPQPGDRVQVRGYRMDDGRIFATRVDVKRGGGGNNGGGGSYNGQATLFPRSNEVVTTTRPPIGATFPNPVTVHAFSVDGRSVPTGVSWDGRQVQWTPNYDLDQGRHTVRLQGTDRNSGRNFQLDWAFSIQNQGGGYYPGPGYPGGQQLYLTNLANGQGVPPNFNVQGNAPAGSRILVTGRYDRALLPGVISLPGGNIRAEGYAHNGHFDIPVQLGNLPAGTRVDLTTTAYDGYGRLVGETTVNLRVDR